ncbi:MAG: hypothetical protein CL920_05655 [Deltaproteobacteria bacterium]|nr:hypothetical protein [Deltaproteobacteria bacterium]MBU48167.1 hypothetical protein [Deltaproteobacteria bacterium]|tara:strand:- start:7037 stop:8311 length:1275 start_codon:yes stop_codon:yes gene_type:complete
MQWTLITLIALFLLLAFAVFWWQSRYQTAEPNQWLIRLRDGKPVQAGIGIQVWLWPGESIARFTSTMQRVTFETEIHTQDKQQIRVHGFLLWSISPKEGHPFQAFSKLGIANRTQEDGQRPEAHHALSRPQHHAFRRSVEALARTAAAEYPLRQILSEPKLLSQSIQQYLDETTSSWGILIESTEITDIHVTQKELFHQLQSPYIEQSRIEAEQIKLQASKEIEELRLEQQRQLHLQRSETERKQEVELAQMALDKEQEKSRLFTEQLELQQRRIEQEAALKTLQEERQHKMKLASLARRKEEALQEEAVQTAITVAQEERKDLALKKELQRRRDEYEIMHTQQQQQLELESQKPQAVRDAEIASLSIEKASAALQQMPIRDIRWMSSSQEGPSALLLQLLDSLQTFSSKLHPTQDTQDTQHTS